MYNPDIHHRKSIRLKQYDYSKEGMYYITICTQNKECILSEITKNDNINNVKNTNDNVGADSISAQDSITQSKLNDIGIMVNNIYLDLENQFINIKLHNYIIMPNHIHGIIEIRERADMESAPTTINEIVQTFKRYTTVEYIKGVKSGIYKPFDKRIWQRNYYEHVIRNEKELYRIIKYIQYNPLNWEMDNIYKK